MSTIGISSWAVDLKDVGAIYPFQGFEVPMVIAAVAFWVLWHIWQVSFESRELNRIAHADKKEVEASIDRF